MCHARFHAYITLQAAAFTSGQCMLRLSWTGVDKKAAGASRFVDGQAGDTQSACGRSTSSRLSIRPGSRQCMLATDLDLDALLEIQFVGQKFKGGIHRVGGVAVGQAHRVGGGASRAWPVGGAGLLAWHVQGQFRGPAGTAEGIADGADGIADLYLLAVAGSAGDQDVLPGWARWPWHRQAAGRAVAGPAVDGVFQSSGKASWQP